LPLGFIAFVFPKGNVKIKKDNGSKSITFGKFSLDAQVAPQQCPIPQVKASIIVSNFI